LQVISGCWQSGWLNLLALWLVVLDGWLGFLDWFAGWLAVVAS
jgi:hypothetical protein